MVEERRHGQARVMAVFVLRRVLWSIPVMLVVVTAIFFLMRSIGGDPFRHGTLLGLAAQSNGRFVKYGDYRPPAIRHNLEHRYGLDLPWYRQYLNFLEGVATFNYGSSLSFRNTYVNDIVKERSWPSIELGLFAFVWAFGVGVPLGVLAALRPGSLFDFSARVLANLGFAVPNFLVATLLIYLLAVKLGWLPTSGWSGWQHRILPSLTLGLLPMAYCTRLVRGAMLETLEQEYVRAARAKGLRRRRIVGIHALRNSLIPVVTAAGPLFGYLVTGSFIVEMIFGVPGIGRYYIASVLARDYTVVLAITVLLALVIILVNLIVDVLYALLDPRIRLVRA
jgi:oligopeptide transport system permease protein